MSHIHHQGHLVRVGYHPGGRGGGVLLCCSGGSIGGGDGFRRSIRYIPLMVSLCSRTVDGSVDDTFSVCRSALLLNSVPLRTISPLGMVQSTTYDFPVEL